MNFLDSSVLPADPLGHQRKFAGSTFVVRARTPVDHAPHGPGRGPRGLLGRAFEEFDGSHRLRPLPERGAHTVRTRIPSTQNNDVLSPGIDGDFRIDFIAVAAFVLLGQKIHRVVNAIEFATFHREVPAVLSPQTQEHCIEVLAQFGHTQINPDINAGLEGNALGLHLVEPRVDVALLHLEFRNPVAKQSADPIIFFENRDAVPRPAELLGRSESRRTRAHHRHGTASAAQGNHRFDPAVLPALLDNAQFDILDGDRVIVIGDATGFLARCRTDAAREFGKVIG